MKKLIPVLISCILFAGISKAQNDIDALRYSQSSLYGTARYVSMGGAFGALGSDFSVLSSNPAGIGLYSKSELNFTPDIFLAGTKSLYLGSNSSDIAYKFNVGSIGMIATSLPKEQSSSWKNWNFGIGYNRINTFQQRSRYEGDNASNSLLDNYLGQLNKGSGKNPGDLAYDNPFDANLAYQTYLLDTIPGDTTHYYSAVPFGGVKQRRTFSSAGTLGEVVISFGGNYNDRLYLGATLGIPLLRYSSVSTYEEIDHKDTIPVFKSFTQNENQSGTGTGVNLKLGMIFRATDWLRLGAAVHTPTFFSITDNWSSKFTSHFDSGHEFSASSPQGGPFDYELTTPLKAIGSAAFIIGKMGVISADYEMLDYSSARLSSTQYSFFDENNAVQNKYTLANNIHIGTEWRFQPFSVRGGFAYYGKPFAAGVAYPSADMSKTCISLGFGIRDAGYFLDIGYIYSFWSDYYSHYSLPAGGNPGAVNKISTQNILLSLGCRF